MIKFFLMICLFFYNPWAYALQDDEIIYTFNIDKINSNQLDVNVEFLGNESGSTEIVLPWDGYNKYIVNDNITFSVENGYEISKFENNRITVLHHPYAEFKLTYSILHDKDVSFAQSPYIQKDFFSFYSVASLVHPEINLSEKVNLTFDFSSMDEEFEIYSSLDIGKKITVNMTIEDLHFLQFTGTKTKASIYELNNHPLHIIEHGYWPQMSDERPASILTKILQLLRDEMGDYDFPYYVVVINQQPDYAQVKTISGLHNRNNLLISFPDGPHYKLDRVKYAMVHEGVHGWIGNKISMPIAMVKSYKWFVEGFTDYFAMLFSKKGNVVSEEMYLSRLNDYAKEYYSEIYHKAPNQLYVKLSGPTKPDLQFNNAKGFFLAHWFVEMLKEKKMDTDSIRFFIKELVLQTYNKNRMLSEEIFWESFDKFFDSDFKALFEKHITQGELMILPPIDGFVLQEEDMEVLEIGFDIVESIKTGKISGLKTDSPAFNAGLKENAIYIDHVVIYDGDRVVKVQIAQDSNGEQEVFSYIPEYVNKKIPQYIRI